MKPQLLSGLLSALLSIIIITSCDGPPGEGETASRSSQEMAKINGIPVEAWIVKTKDAQKKFTSSGVLKAAHAVDIVAEVSGKIQSIKKRLGDYVSTTHIMAVIDDKIPLSNYEQAKSQVLSAENNLNIAQLNLKSDEELFNSGDISKLEYENSLLNVKTAEANHLSALASLSLMEKSYHDTRIRSPINGSISRKYIDLGTMVTPNMTVYRVVDLSSLKLEIGVPQKLISHVQPDARADLILSALPGRNFTGYIRYISPEAVERTGAFTVEIEVKNTTENQIRAGMTAKVEIILNNVSNQTVVPDHAIISKNGQSYIYKISDDTATLMPIITGESYANMVSVEDGVVKGDTIVVVGFKNLNEKSNIWIESIQ
jgi:RND family efflux transporter MFP subunit